MYYPKLVYASFTKEGLFLFGILCLFNKIYGLESLYYIGNFQIIHMEEPNKSHWETPLLKDSVVTPKVLSRKWRKISLQLPYPHHHPPESSIWV